MTIIEPNKNKLKFNLATMLLIGAVILGVLLNIYLYNLTVNLKYSLNQGENHLNELRTANADLKNSVYKILDADNFTILAGKLGLIKDNKPEYLESHAADVAVLSH